MKETDALDDYILQHIDEEGEYLKALYRATHVKLLRPRMASGHLQGRMLKMFVQMIRPKQVLEIGTYLQRIFRSLSGRRTGRRGYAPYFRDK